MCDKQMLLQIGLPHTLKSSNKQLMHEFPHFVVRLKSRFCTLVLIFIFDVNMYSSRLRLFMTESAISLLPATHGQCI